MKSKNRLLFSHAIVIALSAAVAGPLSAASSTWTSLTSGGNWADAANWNNGAGPIADGAGSKADFSAIDTPAGFTVNLAVARTIGELAFGDTDPVNTPGNWTISGPATLTLDGAAPIVSATVPATISTTLAGTNGLTKNGADRITLTGNNATTFSGPLTLNAGTLALAGGQANVQNAIGGMVSPVTFNGGTLALNGSGNNDNATTWGTFSKPLIVPSGQTGTILFMPRGAVTSQLSGAGTLNIGVRATRADVNGDWSGFTGTLNVFATQAPTFGDFRVNGTNLFANSTLNIGPSVYVSQIFNPPSGTGTQTIQNIGALSGPAGGILAGNPVNGRFVNWTIGALNTNTEFAGVIANGTGAARVTKVGTGTLTLSGENTYTGDTAVNAGTLAIGNGGGTGSLGNTNVAVAPGATLVFNRDNSAASTYAGVLSGGGTVVKAGTGRVNFTGANTYTAGTLIQGGTIGINSASSLGDPAGPVTFSTANGGIEATVPGVVSARPLTITGVTATLGAATAADSYELAGTIGGSGSLAIAGSGIVRLTGANGYSGTTTINSGTLSAANTSGSATSSGAVSLAGGTLAGPGTISGPVTTAAGTAVRPGPVTASSTAVGTLTTGALALAGGTTLFTEFTNATTHDKLVVNGNLTTPGATAGNPVLVDLRAENSVAKWTTLGTYNIIQYSGTFTGTPNTLFKVAPDSVQPGLTYTFSASGGFIRLAITGAAPSEWAVDASGNWSLASNWLNGVPNAVGATAKFGPVITAPRSVTVNSPQTVGFLQFNSPVSYTVNGTSTLTLATSSGNADIGILQGAHTISAPLALNATTNFNFISPAESLTLSGNISGSGGLLNHSPGNLILSGNNTFTGAVDQRGGTLTFSNGSLGNGGMFLNNTSLIWAPGNTQDISNRSILIEDGTVSLNTNGNNVVLANPIGAGGFGAMNKAGAGRLTLAGSPTYSGATSISGGTLQLGTGGAGGALFGPIINNAALAVNLQNNFLFDNPISGTGDFAHLGTGRLILPVTNTFSGTTTIPQASAVLQINDPLALQNSTVIHNTFTGALDISNVSSVTLGALEGNRGLVLTDAFSNPIALTTGGNNLATFYDGSLTGAGSLTKLGTGGMVLAGTNTYSGPTAINGGLIEVPVGGSLGGSAITTGGNGGLLVSGGTVSTGTGAFVPNSGGLLVTSGNVTFSGAVTANGSNGSNASALIKVTGGTLQMASLNLGRTFQIITTQPTAAGADQNLYITGGTVNISGNLDLGVNTAGNSTVSTRIDGGQLNVDGPVTIGLNNAGRWSVIDVNGGTFNSTNTATGVVLGGPNQGNSELLVRAGLANVERIQFGQGAVGGSGVVYVTGGELYVGSGGIKAGSTGSYVSKIELAGGVLGAKAAWTSDQPVTLSGDATVKAAGATGTAADIELSGAITGSGSLTKQGGGLLTLSGARSYDGNTTVGAGTLRLTSAGLADASTVTVNSGATLRLDFAGSDQVGSFVVNGSGMPAGTYGRIGSTAPGVTQTAAITGDGLLVVGTGTGSAYTTWAGANGLTASNNGASQDPDNDGLSNMLEFVLGGNPLASSGSVQPQLTVNATNFVFTFNREDKSEAEVALAFTWGTNPGALTNTVAIGATSSPADANGVTVTVAEGTPADAPDVVTVTVPRTNAVGGKLFGRLRAVK